MVANYNTEIDAFMQTFILENPTSDKAGDLTNKILDTKTYSDYSKISLIAVSSYPQSYFDSLTNRTVSFANKEEVINELVNMAIYRRRSYMPILEYMPQIKTMATELINELEKTYRLK